MKQDVYVTINCDTGLDEIVSVLVDNDFMVVKEWNGAEFEPCRPYIHHDRMAEIFKEFRERNND